MASTVYVVCFPAYDYNDEFYFTIENGYCPPVVAFATKEAADAWVIAHPEDNPNAEEDDEQWIEQNDIETGPVFGTVFPVTVTE